MSTVIPTDQKLRGAYYTPRSIADALVRWAIRDKNDRLLDPACGDAVFLEAAASRFEQWDEAGCSGQIVGFDIDKDAVFEGRIHAPYAQIIQGDFFEQSVNERPFQAVVGNPPFIRYHHFSGHGRKLALERASEHGVQLSGLASSWAPFVVHAASFLEPEGRLAFVLPAELLATDYAASIRQFLSDRFKTVHVLTFEERVFPGALVDVVLLLAEGVGPGHVHVHRLSDLAAMPDLNGSSPPAINGNNWTNGLLSSGQLRNVQEVFSPMRPLGDIASVDIGIVTGANRFFLLSEPDVLEAGLDRSDLRPALGRSRQLGGSSMSRARWRRLRQEGQTAWLFAPKTESAAVSQYIAKGEQDGAHDSYKCRIRSPWWRLKLPDPPDLVLSYMSNQVPRLAANSAALLTTNLLHNVRLQDASVDPVVLALSWNNSATMLSTELVGRAYGGGVLKLETRESERTLVPLLTDLQTQQLRDQSRKIDRLLRDRNFEAVADIIDPIVLSHVDSVAREGLREAWNDLRTRRVQRSRVGLARSNGGRAAT